MQAAGGGGAARRAYRYTNPKRHAIAIQKSLTKRFPRAEFGTVYHKRTSAGGDPGVEQHYGASWADATPDQRANRITHGFYGRGKYSFGKSLRALGGYTKSIGKVINTVGSTGVKAASNFAKARSILGMGLYGGQGIYGGQGEYRQNSLIAGGDMSMQVHAQSDETDSMTLTNREFIKEIYAPDNSGFNMENIECNPGLPGFAPKLAAIAANYQQYEIKQLVFEIVPLISESNVNNGITGTIMAVWNYDTNTDLYDNKEDIMQSSGAVSGRIVDKLTCGVECDTNKVKETEYFTRTCPVPIGRDADEFDHGKLIVATNNVPAGFYNQTIAELYVYYTIELRHFKPGTTRLNGQQREEFLCVQNGLESVTPSQNYASGATTVLRAQQSNMYGRLLGTNPTALISRWAYTFSPEINGNFEIRLYVEFSPPSGSSYTSVSESYTGNVFPVLDVNPGTVGGTGADVPHSHITAGLGGGMNTLITVHHVRVRSATAGVNNSFTVNLGGPGTGNVSSWGFSIVELSMNLWQSRTINNPVYINDATKIQTVPQG